VLFGNYAPADLMYYDQIRQSGGGSLLRFVLQTRIVGATAVDCCAAASQPNRFWEETPRYLSENSRRFRYFRGLWVPKTEQRNLARSPAEGISCQNCI